MKPFSIFDGILSASERKRMQYVGINKLLKPRLNFTSLERKYYLMLKNLDVYYVPQYQLEGKYYDAFLPDNNILLEFDGTFWHPLSKTDCKYDCQKKNIENDKIKDDIAKRHSMKLIRIREESPITTDQLKKLIKG